MAEPTAPPADPTPPASGDGGTPAQQPAGAATIFTQEQVDAIIKDRLERQQRAIDARTAKERADAEAAKLAEQGEFKKLAEAAQAERDALKADLAARDHRDLQRAVATEHKLPPEMAARLQGTTREELVADAKALAALMAQPAAPAAPGNRPNPRPQAGPDAAQAAEAYLRSQPRYSGI